MILLTRTDSKAEEWSLFDFSSRTQTARWNHPEIRTLSPSFALEVQFQGARIDFALTRVSFCSADPVGCLAEGCVRIQFFSRRPALGASAVQFIFSFSSDHFNSSWRAAAPRFLQEKL